MKRVSGAQETEHTLSLAQLHEPCRLEGGAHCSDFIPADHADEVRHARRDLCRDGRRQLEVDEVAHEQRALIGRRRARWRRLDQRERRRRLAPDRARCAACRGGHCCGCPMLPDALAAAASTAPQGQTDAASQRGGTSMPTCSKPGCRGGCRGGGGGAASLAALDAHALTAHALTHRLVSGSIRAIRSHPPRHVLPNRRRDARGGFGGAVDGR
mmetsp:Transcript_20910/g.48200  ORF Transcript_20910/g.48200 Transcript_20910/m.48200 type:complete len:213 (-) Transcript_20910:677-1315(-)